VIDEYLSEHPLDTVHLSFLQRPCAFHGVGEFDEGVDPLLHQIVHVTAPPESILLACLALLIDIGQRG
jgi:hypothetical protein